MAHKRCPNCNSQQFIMSECDGCGLGRIICADCYEEMKETYA